MEHHKPENMNIDVADIMDRIRSRIEEKKKNGQYNTEELASIEQMTLQIQEDGSDPQEGDILYHLSQINYLCDTRKPPELSSHRQVLGTLVSGIKRILYKSTEPYIQMILKRQVEFNVELIRLLNQMALDIRFRWSNQEKQMSLLEKRGEEMAKALEAIPQEMRTQKNVFEEILSRLKEMKEPAVELGPQVDSFESKIRESEYIRFEDLHRGSQEDIKWKQKKYLSFFREKGQVLDIGCGRGEFLELLREAQIPAKGIDLNQEMIRQCQNKGLIASQGDGIEYLRGVEDNSLGGIFLSQVIEHLKPDSLRELVRISFAKLAPGGVLLAETINPQCLSTFSGAFYLDLSHNNPIHPEAARFLWESLGFRQVDILYVSPYPEEMKLKEMVRRHDDSYEDELARVLNENIKSLNALLYGPQDYAVLGYK